MLKILLASSIFVIDGDTIRYNQETIRLSGFDTPETYRSQCKYEKIKGYEAKARLIELVRAGTNVSIHLKTRKNGQLSKGRYGRYIGTLLVDGTDVGKTLIDEDLARPYYGGKRLGWC